MAALRWSHVDARWKKLTIADKVDAALEAGADYVIFYVPGVAYDLDLLERVENITKRFA